MTNSDLSKSTKSDLETRFSDAFDERQKAGKKDDKAMRHISGCVADFIDDPNMNALRFVIDALFAYKSAHDEYQKARRNYDAIAAESE